MSDDRSWLALCMAMCYDGIVKKNANKYLDGVKQQQTIWDEQSVIHLET